MSFQISTTDIYHLLRTLQITSDRSPLVGNPHLGEGLMQELEQPSPQTSKKLITEINELAVQHPRVILNALRALYEYHQSSANTHSSANLNRQSLSQRALQGTYKNIIQSAGLEYNNSEFFIGDLEKFTAFFIRMPLDKKLILDDIQKRIFSEAIINKFDELISSKASPYKETQAIDKIITILFAADKVGLSELKPRFNDKGLSVYLCIPYLRDCSEQDSFKDLENLLNELNLVFQIEYSSTKDQKLKLGDIEITRLGCLEKRHFKQLQKESGLNRNSIETAGIETVEFGDYGKALLIPYFDLNNNIQGYQIRLDSETQSQLNAANPANKNLRMSNDKVRKYQEIGDVYDKIYYPKDFDRNIDSPLIITEGIKKVLKLKELVGKESQVISINGSVNIDCLIDDLGESLKNRRIYLIYDGDVHVNPKVAQAQTKTYKRLKDFGADPRIVNLSLNPNNAKKAGIDDFIVDLEQQNLEAAEVIKDLLMNADRDGIIQDPVLQSIVLSQEITADKVAEKPLTEIPSPQINKATCVQDLENLIDINKELKTVINEFKDQAAKFGESFMQKIDSDFSQLVSMAKQIRQEVQNDRNFDIEKNQKLIDDMKSVISVIDARFKYEYVKQLQDAIKFSVNNLFQLQANPDYLTLKREKERLDLEFKAKPSDISKVAQAISEVVNKLKPYENKVLEPVREFLSKLKKNPELSVLILESLAVNEVQALTQNINILLELKMENDLKGILETLVKEIDSFMNFANENRAENILTTASSPYSQFVKSKLLKGILDRSSPLVRKLSIAFATEFGFNYIDCAEKFINNIYKLKGWKKLGKVLEKFSLIVDKVKEDIRAQKTLNPKEMLDFFQQVDHARRFHAQGLSPKGFGAGDILTNQTMVLNSDANDVLWGVDTSSQSRMIETLNEQGLTSSQTKSRFLALDLKQPQSDQMRFLAIDTYTGAFTALDTLKPMQELFIETGKKTNFYSPLDIGFIIRDETNKDCLVYNVPSLKDFIATNPMVHAPIWGEAVLTSTAKPSFEKKFLEIERKLLLCKALWDNVKQKASLGLIITMNLSEIEDADGKIDKSNSIYKSLRGMFDYLDGQFGKQLMSGVKIYNQNLKDVTEQLKV